MKTTLFFTGAALCILLVFSAFFSASETSLTSITKIKLRQIKNGKSKKDTLIARILSDPPRMLTTLLIGNNIVNIWASSIATAFAISIFGGKGIGIATVVMTVIIVIFSEITPKTIAANDPVNLARFLSPAVLLTLKILFPFYILFSLVNALFIAVLRKISPDTVHRITEDELKTMMDVGKKEGVLEEGEHNLLNHAFDFTDLKLREIMTPRTSIAAIPINASFTEIQDLFRKHQFSRMPVYEESIDSIQGMIHYKDILFLLECGEEGTFDNLVRPVLFVPETQSTFELLKEMEHSSQNMAVIVDEHGGTAGLVTIDDAVAAVFGGIHDEYDTAETEPMNLVQVLGPNHVKVPGNLPLNDLNALLNTDLDSDFYETVNGFLMEQAESLPAQGDRIRFQNIKFVIEEQANRKIKRVDIIVDSE